MTVTELTSCQFSSNLLERCAVFRSYLISFGFAVGCLRTLIILYFGMGVILLFQKNNYQVFLHFGLITLSVKRIIL